MRKATLFGALIALAAMASGGSQASACDYCRGGYYSYYGPAAYRFYHPSRNPYFRGHRWDFAAAYYNSPVVYGTYPPVVYSRYRRPRAYGYGYYAGPRVYGAYYRGHFRGPRMRGSRRW